MWSELWLIKPLSVKGLTKFCQSMILTSVDLLRCYHRQCFATNILLEMSYAHYFQVQLLKLWTITLKGMKSRILDQILLLSSKWLNVLRLRVKFNLFYVATKWALSHKTNLLLLGSGLAIDHTAYLPQLRFKKSVVLHISILFGLRVMYLVKHTYWFDIYKVHAWLDIRATLINESSAIKPISWSRNEFHVELWVRKKIIQME